MYFIQQRIKKLFSDNLIEHIASEFIFHFVKFENKLWKIFALPPPIDSKGWSVRTRIFRTSEEDDLGFYNVVKIVDLAPEQKA